ncbi:hypothetical protein [Candidatus Oscillochloris fontis]|uniref:hypothetical protein n=1 Tax=Candidatus Oscillochloris fontis TaxID=2496868 RepID=UPI00101DF667|nr:hypothetical protein [Candidatus Oscillochloris fontis]
MADKESAAIINVRTRPTPNHHALAVGDVPRLDLVSPDMIACPARRFRSRRDLRRWWRVIIWEIGNLHPLRTQVGFDAPNLRTRRRNVGDGTRRGVCAPQLRLLLHKHGETVAVGGKEVLLLRLLVHVHRTPHHVVQALAEECGQEYSIAL